MFEPRYLSPASPDVFGRAAPKGSRLNRPPSATSAWLGPAEGHKAEDCLRRMTRVLRSAHQYAMKIELRSVVKSYRSVRALDHVSLEIGPGQIVSLLGPNGAGKTTVLRCLSGIAAPDNR